MSLQDAFVHYAQNKNTNRLVAAARAVGVTKTEKEIVKAAEVAAKPYDDRSLTTAELEQRADQFVAAIQ